MEARDRIRRSARGLRRCRPASARCARSAREGEGDFLLAGDVILAGRGFRSTDDSHAEIARVFGREVVSLSLVDARFYHLDTALSVLDPVVAPGETPTIAYLPAAFDDASRAELERRFPDAIRVADADGSVFGLNSASDGRHVFVSPRATGFAAQLRERGYEPVPIDLSELLLGGGGIKCCTLELRGGAGSSSEAQAGRDGSTGRGVPAGSSTGAPARSGDSETGGGCSEGAGLTSAETDVV